MSPLTDMKAAIRGQLWSEAALFTDTVLAKYPDDPQVLAFVAEVAYHTDQPDRSADLLVEACHLESLADEGRIRQTMIALVNVGRLYDGIDLLDEALARHPDQMETCRMLYDLYVGTEDRRHGVPLGQRLVRERHFDIELLMTLGHAPRRTLDTEPLLKMSTRHPDDLRPLIGQARAKYDANEYGEAIRMTRDIISKHPGFLPARLLLGRSLAASERLDEIEAWADAQPRGSEADADYWMVLGEWARARRDTGAAVRAYWEATRRAPDATEPWSKLSLGLQILDDETAEPYDDLLPQIHERVALLSDLDQAKHRFERTGKISRAICLEIIENLRDLGRPWEAEAWASIALTLPTDETVPILETRQAIISELHSDTPWQITSGFPELTMDLRGFELPEIARVAPSHEPATAESPPSLDPAATNQSGLRFNDEAVARGLEFYGRTSDHLDVPGIMLSETLGCGGGAIDYDLDGWADLYCIAAGGTPPNRDSSPNGLFQNRTGQFFDVTLPTGTGNTGFGQGVAVGDVNEDGFPDLLVLNYGPNALYINQGDGTFIDASEKIATHAPEEIDTDWATSGAIADIDGDSIADIVILNYCAGLGAVTEGCPMAGRSGTRACTPVKFPALEDRFLQGQADGRFIDRTDDWLAIPQIPGRGLGLVVGSLDHVPGNDVFVANDMTNNHYWSRQAGTDDFIFTDSAMPRGLAANDRLLAQGSMGIAVADFDGDGDMDIFVTNFENEYNTYYEQVHNGIWRDRTNPLNLVAPAMPMVGFGSQAVDLDLDGRLELVVTNGHVDLFSRGEKKAQYAQPMQIFRRRADSTFESIERSVGGEYMPAMHVGRGLWTIDANQDGRTDLVVTHQTEPVSLLINACEPRGKWLEIELRGTRCSRDAIGAIVRVQREDVTWTQPLIAGDGYLCSNERAIRFGLGEGNASVDVHITWPGGDEQVVTNLPPNGRWLVIQDDQEVLQSF